jgi:cellulose synthase (UDP-forming)
VSVIQSTGRQGNLPGVGVQLRKDAPRPLEDPVGLLPVPPDDWEKYSYVKRHVWVRAGSSLVAFVCLVLSQLGALHSSPALWVFAPLLLLSALGYLISLRLEVFSPGFDVKGHRRLVRRWRPVSYPSVDVFLPVCGEPLEVLHNTWTYVGRLAEHYPGKVVPYVLDDSDSASISTMADDFGFRYLVRPNRGWFKKAGNLRYGFANSRGDFILILDADFAPRSDLLDELLPYMDQDPKLGIVQSPQFFRVLDQQNWIERGAAAVQELFYRAVQASRQAVEGSICVGTCAVYRRAALDDIGGTALIEHSEDVHTGFDLRSRGWGLRYVPIALSTGVCPDTIGAFQNQQYRWCMGSMSLLGSKKFWATKMRPATRMCYFSGFIYYIETALLTLVTPLIPLTLMLAVPDTLRVEGMWLVLPSLVYVAVIFPIWHRNPYRLEAWSTRVMYGWAHLFAIWDIIRGRPMGWQPTGASATKKNKTRRFWIGMWGWSGVTAALWVAVAIWRMATVNPEDFALLLASGLFYAITVARILIQPRTDEPAS